MQKQKYLIKNKNCIKIIDDGLMNLFIENKYDLMKQRNRDEDTTGCVVLVELQVNLF